MNLILSSHPKDYTNKTALLSTHNICFDSEIKILLLFLSQLKILFKSDENLNHNHSLTLLAKQTINS